MPGAGDPQKVPGTERAITVPRGTMHSMSPDLYVIKLGSTLPDLAVRMGDFEDWIIRGMGVAREVVVVVDPTRGEALPDPAEVAGAVLSGSHAMVTGNEPWSERTAVWLCDAVALGVPVLGICYGHQLLAYALGGEVGDNPLGHELGTVTTHLTSDAASDPLLGGLGPTITVHASHAQTVLRLPDGATCLATSAMDRHMAFSLGGSAWGVQFHPEFDAEVGRAYIEAEAAVLAAENQDPVALLASCVDGPVGSTILSRFAALVRARLQ